MKNKALYLLAIVALLFSCTQGEAYYRFHHLKNGQWHQDSVLVFKMDSLSFNPVSRYDVSLEFAENSRYAYRDCWVYIRHNLTDTVFHTDSLQIILSDEFGKPIGSGVGGLYQLSVPYVSSIVLDTARVYEMHIRHAMRDEWLQGVEKVGVKVMER